MTIRLNQCVVSGVLDNRQRNRIEGTMDLYLAPAEAVPGKTKDEATQLETIHIKLIGNFAGDLAGKKICFRANRQSPPQPLCDDSFSNHAGAMVTFSWQPRITPPIPVEYVETVEQLMGPLVCGERFNALYIEWLGPFGRAVLELVNPEVQLVGADGQESPLKPNLISELVPSPTELAEPMGIMIERVDLTAPTGEILDEPGGTGFSDPGDLPQNSVRSILDAFDSEMEKHFRDIDEMVSGVNQIPVIDLIPNFAALPTAAELADEEEAWAYLQQIIGCLVPLGVEFDMCPHFTARRAYDFLLENLREITVQPFSVTRRFTVHMDAFEDCPGCIREMYGIDSRDYRLDFGEQVDMWLVYQQIENEDAAEGDEDELDEELDEEDGSEGEDFRS